MRVNLSFVPIGGGEQNYMLALDMPAPPNPGDWISVSRPGQTGTEDFIVTQIVWRIEANDGGPSIVPFGETPPPSAAVQCAWVECEFAESATSTEEHKKAHQAYAVKTGRKNELRSTMY